MAPRCTFDLVIFDLDGTLIATAREICDAVNDTLRQVGAPAVDAEQVTHWIGNGTPWLLRQALASALGTSPQAPAHADILAVAQATFVTAYEARCGTRSHLYRGAAETLAALAAASVPAALVTNKEARYTHRVLAAHGLETRFDPVICGDTLPRKKPAPDGIEACLAHCKVARDRALFVGDSRVDAAAARAAGVTVWLLPHGYNLGEPIDRVDADRVVADFAELQGRLLHATAS